MKYYRLKVMINAGSGTTLEVSVLQKSADADGAAVVVGEALVMCESVQNTRQVLLREHDNSAAICFRPCDLISMSAVEEALPRPKKAARGKQA